MMALLLAIAPFVEAQEKPAPAYMGTDLPFQEGALIRFVTYDEKTRTYEAIVPGLIGEGVAYVSPEAAARSIRALDLKRLVKNPTCILGNDYSNEIVMPVLSPEERNARKATFAGHKRPSFRTYTSIVSH